MRRLFEYRSPAGSSPSKTVTGAAPPRLNHARINRLRLARREVDCHGPAMVQTIQPTVPATIYIRWSSDAQTGRDSLRRQLEAAQRYADEHRLVIVETIIDEAISAFSGDHLTKGRLGTFIGRVRAGDLRLPHVLVVESLDRLKRQAPLDALAPFITLINAGVTLVTLTDRQEFTKQGMAEDGGLKLLGSLIVMLRAHEESATKSKRVRAAWERKRKDAGLRKLTKVCPAWLRLAEDRSQFLLIQDRADVVRLVFEETALGIGKASIAARLNARDVSPFRGSDGWHPSYVQKLIASDAPIGIFQPHIMQDGRRVPAGPPIEGYFPPIIERALLMRARAAVISRRHDGAGRKGFEFRNILTSIAKCARCGSRMTYVGKGDAERYLACSSARRRRTCEVRTLFNFNEAEHGFLASVDRFDPAMCDASQSLDAARNSVRLACARAARLSARLLTLLDAFGTDQTEEIVRAISKVRDDLALSRAEERRSMDALILEEHGAGIGDLRAAIADLCDLGPSPSGSAAFAARARVAHSAKCAGFSASFEPHERRVEVNCRGFAQVVRFSCSPARSHSVRDASGRFSRASALAGT